MNYSNSDLRLRPDPLMAWALLQPVRSVEEKAPPRKKIKKIRPA